jgi:hypothetical protein
LSNGAGVFYREATEEDTPTIIGRDNVYDITQMFKENNG